MLFLLLFFLFFLLLFFLLLLDGSEIHQAVLLCTLRYRCGVNAGYAGYEAMVGFGFGFGFGQVGYLILGYWHVW